MQIQHVTILGLTYTTAAIGLLMRGLFQGKGRVIGHAPQVELLKEALERDILDQAPKNWRESIVETDLLIIDWPLADLENLYREIGFRLQPHTLVLDFSRLKGPVYHLAQTHLKTSKFIGVASLLATDQLMMGASSLAAATPDIFKNSHFCLVAHPTISQETLDQAIAFGRLLGAEPIFSDPLEYDGLAQILELLPILTASALLRTVANSEGWQDMSRYAGLTFATATQATSLSSDAIWMVQTQKSGLLPTLDSLIAHLQTIRQQVAQKDAAALQAHLQQVEQIRSQWLAQRLVPNTGEPDLLDEVEDRNFLRQLFTFKRHS